MKEKIKTNVIAYIASFAHMPVSKMKDEFILKDHPLKLDDVQLGFLTIALRAYVKNINISSNLTASELRKGGLDVKKTYELIIKKAKL